MEGRQVVGRRPAAPSTPSLSAFLMLRRHSWLKPLSSSSSSRPASGTWKTYCGCPAANPSSVDGGRQPRSRSVVATRSPDVVGGVRRYVGQPPGAALGDGGLHGRGRPAAAHDRRAHLDAERALAAQVLDHRRQPGREVVGAPSRAPGPRAGRRGTSSPSAPAGAGRARRRRARRCRRTSRGSGCPTPASPRPTTGTAGTTRTGARPGTRGARRC